MKRNKNENKGVENQKKIELFDSYFLYIKNVF
jgi:hypothetical protein